MLPEYITFLTSPENYPHPVDAVELIQTHISYVTLAGDYVYKWKKPVNFGFVDFSTLHKREYYCRRELLLNRRLCPQIYLDVVWLSTTESGFAFGGDGKIIEFAVRMARMPEEGMLSRVIAAGKLQEKHLETIIALLVPFYQAAGQGKKVRKYGTVEAVSRTIVNNFAQMQRFVGCREFSQKRHSIIKEATDSFLGKKEVFLERLRGQHIRDCHGDLYSNNICLAPDGGVYIFDCLEFNDTLRFIDTCADVAFLAMDLDYHGLRPLSTFFIERFIAASKDYTLSSVLDFYKCYRALVRGKVGLLTAVDPALSPDLADKWRQSAARYLQLAEEYAERL